MFIFFLGLRTFFKKGKINVCIQVKFSALNATLNGGRYNKIFWTESFNDGMQDVLDHIDVPNAIKLKDVPRFNESEGHGPKRAHPVEDYFDDLSMHLMYEIYKRDFKLFKYDFENPGNKMPIGEIDLDEVHAKLGD